ncbi:MAG: class I SAM-dependent methyltransferase [Candidatus Promineifilaceae bacterium]
MLPRPARTRQADKPDLSGHNALYAAGAGRLAGATDKAAFTRAYEREHMAPFHAGGSTKGYVRGLATRRLLADAARSGRRLAELRVLETGSGRGELALYLAGRGFQVIGVDLSQVGCRAAGQLAERLELASQCRFVAADLAHLPLAAGSVDFVIGHAALHHFIKYPGVPAELERVMRPGASGCFADAFGQNRLYHLFHDRARMARLGDVSLTAAMIGRYFAAFGLELRPTDWFVMLDKLYLRLAPASFEPFLRRLSRLHFWLDRRLPAGRRPLLALSGSVLTVIHKR